MFKTVLEDRVAIHFREPTKIQYVKELSKDSCEVCFMHKKRDETTFNVTLMDQKNFLGTSTTSYVRHWETRKVMCVSSTSAFDRMCFSFEGIHINGVIFSFYRKPLPGGAALPKRPDREEMYMLGTKLQLEGYDI